MYNNVCSHVQRLLVSISHDQRFIEFIVTLNNQRIDWYFVIFKITYSFLRKNERNLTNRDENIVL